MIPSIIADTSITFIARGRPVILAADHPAFEHIKLALSDENADEDELLRMVDVRVAVSDFTDGRVELTDDGLKLDGEALAEGWTEAALSSPEATRVLVVSAGDRVRVEGDEDAPDGIYLVCEVDNQDAKRRIYVESEDDFFGFVSNTSIKEIIRE